jgi:hypothetical protein
METPSLDFAQNLRHWPPWFWGFGLLDWAAICSTGLSVCRWPLWDFLFGICGHVWQSLKNPYLFLFLWRTVTETSCSSSLDQPHTWTHWQCQRGRACSWLGHSWGPPAVQGLLWLFKYWSTRYCLGNSINLVATHQPTEPLSPPYSSHHPATQGTRIGTRRPYGIEAVSLGWSVVNIYGSSILGFLVARNRYEWRGCRWYGSWGEVADSILWDPLSLTWDCIRVFPFLNVCFSMYTGRKLHSTPFYRKSLASIGQISVHYRRMDLYPQIVSKKEHKDNTPIFSLLLENSITNFIRNWRQLGIVLIK